MPAASGGAFVGAMDKMLCGMSSDLGISRAEIEAIRGDLVGDVRKIGGDGLAKMQGVRVGGAQIIRPTSANLKQLGITSQRSEERFTRFRLQWLDKDNLNQKITQGFSKADQADFHRHSQRLARNAKSFLREIEELDPSLEDEVEATIRQIDDARADLLKLELKGWTQLDERLRRGMGNGLTRDALGDSVRTYDLNRNLFNLSLLEHPQGVSRDLLAASSERMAARVKKITAPEIPKKAFMVAGVCPGGPSAVPLRPGGRTAEIAWRVMSVEALTARAAAAATATQRAGSGFRGLGEGPGTQEFYVPVPPENLDEVREIMRERRASFMARSPAAGETTVLA